MERDDPTATGRARGARRPRVLEVGPDPRSEGGIAAVIQSLVDSPLRDRYDVRVIATYVDGGAARKLVQAVVALARIAAVLVARRVDVVHLHTSSGASLWRKALAARLARATRVPYVLHVHSGDFVDWYEAAPGWESALVRSTFRHAAVVVALSPGWEARLRGIAPCRTTSIPNPVSVPAAPATPTWPPTVVSLGRLGDAKGSGVLVRALAQLGDDHPDVRLVLAGDGDPAPLAAEAERLGVGERVSMPGWVGPDERRALLSRATAFALPSRSEGMPVALLEAMAYGLPAVASRVGSIPEILTDGRDGLLVDPDDVEGLAGALRVLLEDADGAQRMGLAARAAATARFSSETVAERLSDTLDAARAWPVGRSGPSAGA